MHTIDIHVHVSHVIKMIIITSIVLKAVFRVLII